MHLLVLFGQFDWWFDKKNVQACIVPHQLNVDQPTACIGHWKDSIPTAANDPHFLNSTKPGDEKQMKVKRQAKTPKDCVFRSVDYILRF